MRFYTMEELRQRMKECNIQALAAKIEVHPQTLYAMQDEGRQVNYSTYEKLVKYFEGMYHGTND